MHTLNTDSTDLHIRNQNRQKGIRLIELDYFSHEIDGFPLNVCAYLALPAGNGPFPAILHLHGGAQCADPAIALAWARRGYATLCPDWSIPAGNSTSPLPTAWPEGTPQISDTTQPPGLSPVGHIVHAVRRGISLLSEHPDVQSNRIGIIGISWGGLMTWLVNGTDTRLRTAIPVYGCGHPPERKVAPAWLDAFQPANVAHSQHAPLLYLNGTHDFFGHLDTAEALLAEVPVPTRHLYVPNEDHGLNEDARRTAAAWMAFHLKGEGTLPPQPDFQHLPPEQTTYFESSHPHRRAVWRQISPDNVERTSNVFATVTDPQGFSFSTSVLRNNLSTTQENPTALYDPAVEGCTPIFLRWEYGNLALHQPASATPQLNDQGLHLHPTPNTFTVFLRNDSLPPDTCTGITLCFHSVKNCKVSLHLFTQPDINDNSRWSHPDVLSTSDISQSLHFAFKNFNPAGNQKLPLSPADIHILKLEIESGQSILQKILWH